MRIKQNYRNRTKINIDKWIHKTCDKKKDKTYDFKKQYKTIKFFQREIHSNAFTLEDELEEQIKFKNQIDIFKESTKPKNPHRLLRGRQKFFYGFESGKFFCIEHKKLLKNVIAILKKINNGTKQNKYYIYEF